MSKNFLKIKKELENDWIAESIKGKVKYQLIKYRKSHDSYWGRLSILLDKETMLNISDLEIIMDVGYIANDNFAEINKGNITTNIFYASYHCYQNMNIQECIESPNALIRLFATFDRRIGKNRFLSLKATLVGESTWLIDFYNFRKKYELLK